MEIKKVFRVLDVNFNRSKEGLRVVEDIFRFILEDDALRKITRDIRHSLDSLTADKKLREEFMSCRDSEKDIGKDIDSLEMKRENISDIFYVNLQRVKESLRVMEEFFKIPGIEHEKVELIKRNRYKVYELERNAAKKWSCLFNP